jgi:DNA-binding MarR family transcriptional regulator
MAGSSYIAPLSGRVALDQHGRSYDPEIRLAVAQLGASHPDPLAAETVRVLLAAGQRLLAAVEEALAPLGLSAGRYALLACLWATEGATAPLHDLAERCSVSARNVTGLVDALVRDGLVERVASVGDRRVVLARLTPRGAELTSRAVEICWALEAAVCAGLDDDRRRALVDTAVTVAGATVSRSATVEGGK